MIFCLLAPFLPSIFHFAFGSIGLPITLGPSAVIPMISPSFGQNLYESTSKSTFGIESGLSLAKASGPAHEGHTSASSVLAVVGLLSLASAFDGFTGADELPLALSDADALGALGSTGLPSTFHGPVSARPTTPCSGHRRYCSGSKPASLGTLCGFNLANAKGDLQVGQTSTSAEDIFSWEFVMVGFEGPPKERGIFRLLDPAPDFLGTRTRTPSHDLVYNLSLQHSHAKLYIPFDGGPGQKSNSALDQSLLLILLAVPKFRNRLAVPEFYSEAESRFSSLSV